MKSLIGTGVALITPFKDDGSIDTEMLIRIVEHNIQCGVDYLVVLGTTAEAPTLSKSERLHICKIVSEVNNGRVPMVLGVSSNNTLALVEETKSVNVEDYIAVLSVTPSYNKPTQEGVYQHFLEVSKASPLPLILYNVPHRTGTNINPETVLRLCKASDKIIAIKEAADDMHQALRLLKILPDDFLVISGSDSLALPLILSGGVGVISVLGGALPKEFSQMVSHGLNGEVKDGYDIYYRLIDLIDHIFEEGNPVGIKAVIKTIMGSSSQVRLPLVRATDALQSKIDAVLSEL